MGTQTWDLPDILDRAASKSVRSLDDCKDVHQLLRQAADELRTARKQAERYKWEAFDARRKFKEHSIHHVCQRNTLDSYYKVWTTPEIHDGGK